MSIYKISRESILSKCQVETSPFTKLVVAAIKKLYPEKLADTSFDNTGLLLEAPYRPHHLNNSVLLTIDLTTAVTDEAIARKDSIIIAYHPIIFRPLKSLTLRNTQQTTLLRLAQEGISVYCPHTAVDAAVGGVNDWLADIVTGKEANPSEYSLHTLSIINPVREPVESKGAGYGRIIRFHDSVSLKIILERITKGLDAKNGLYVALPQKVSRESMLKLNVSSVGVCAGSGGSILNGLDVDLLFTGELSHHEALAAIEMGKVVITAGHSNTERNFLKSRLCRSLREGIQSEIMGEQNVDSITDAENLNFSVDVSKFDRDPYEILRLDMDSQ